jgi:hypothetical protein
LPGLHQFCDPFALALDPKQRLVNAARSAFVLWIGGIVKA